MGKISLIVITFCLFTLTCFSQKKESFTTREGVIQPYQEEKQVRTRDFWIKYFSQEDSTYTDNGGTFTITFNKKPNYPTALSVYPSPFGSFKNYKVVNTYDINNISEFDNSEIAIFVADKKIMRQQQELFYEIISKDIKKYFQDSIMNLRIIYKDSVEKLNQLIGNLEKELNKKDQRIRELSEQLDQTDLELRLLKDNPLILQNETYEKNSLRLIDAHNFFSQGKIDSARMCIPKNIDEISDLNIKESKMLFAFYQLDAAIEEIQGNYSQAIEQYKKALKHTGKDVFREYITCISIAELENILNNYDSAFKYANKAAELKEINDIYKIKTYNLKGKIRQDCDNYKQAIKLYKTIKKEYGNAIIEVAEKEAAKSYMLLGDYYKQKEKNESAKTNYHKALDIYTELNKIEEFEIEAQCFTLSELIIIYNDEGKESMVKKCTDRIILLNNTTGNKIMQNPKIILQRAIVSMQSGDFSGANVFYAMALGNYKNNASNQYQQEIIETLFLTGLNQFYDKSYSYAYDDFSQANDLLSRDSVLLGKKDFVRLKSLCIAAMGITKKEQGEKENGLLLYSQATSLVENDINLSKNEKKILLKDIKHLKKYSKLETNNFIKQIISGVCSFGILFIPLML